MIEIKQTPLAGLMLIVPKRFHDHRGFFQEAHSQRHYTAAGLAETFIQTNVAHSNKRGTIRGMHFQKPPHAQGQLVFALHGAVRDVVVDIRTGSPTYGQHYAVDLSAENGLQLYMPEGFAHGYCTLTDNALVMYKVNAFYAHDSEGGLRWNDPALGIDWGVPAEECIALERDSSFPLLADLVSPF